MSVNKQTTACKYQPRNSFVLIQQTDRGVTAGGVAIPETSQQGKKNTVVAIGPKVEGLAVGDSVLVIGTLGEDLVRLPLERDLFVTKEVNVLLVVNEG